MVLSWALEAQQTALTIDVGTSRLRFADSINATALSVSPTLRVTSPRASLWLTGTLSRIGESSSNSGVIDAELMTNRPGRVWGELQGIAGGSTHNDGTRTGQLLGLARVNFADRRRGAWLGGGTGTTWDGAWRMVLQGDAGAWLATSAGSALFTVAPTVVDDTIRYADLTFGVLRSREPWEFTGTLGARAGNQLPTLPANDKVWGNLSAIYWANPSIGLAASAGTYPVDFTQGFPGGRFVSLSIRWRASRVGALAPAPRVVPSGDVREFQTRKESGDLQRVRVFAPTARGVSLMGDFTAWSPMAMAPEGGGWWGASVVLRRGTHEIALRVNNGPWLVPPGLTPLKDEFGGSTGLLVIP